MIRAYRLYTGIDGNSDVVQGSVNLTTLVEARSIVFKETTPNSSYDLHNDPIPQYVITLAGVLEFATASGDVFTLNPGEVLIAEDHTGSGHKWRLTNDDTWRRAYVVFKEGADTYRYIQDDERGAGDRGRRAAVGAAHVRPSPQKRGCRKGAILQIHLKQERRKRNDDQSGNQVRNQDRE